MTKSKHGKLALFLLAAVALGGFACELINPTTHVGNGQLYMSGDPKFDAYFKEVYALQAQAAAFEDDERAARKPLVAELSLTLDSSDDYIAQAAHDRMTAAAQSFGGGAKLEVGDADAHFVTASSTRGDAKTERLMNAIEANVHAELVRAKALDVAGPRADTLMQTGKDLEPTLKDVFGKVSPQKPNEVRPELSSAQDALYSISHAARRDSQKAHAFVDALQRAVSIGPAPEGDTPATGSAPIDAGIDAEVADAAEEAAAKPPPPPPVVHHPVVTQQPVTTYQPPPPPPPTATATATSTGEVFNP
jgi:hypothetical protein